MEFVPYDRESQSEIRKHTYKSNRAKNGSGSGGSEQNVGSGSGKQSRVSDTGGRKKPSRNKPPLALVVTLKPLTPIIPPSPSLSSSLSSSWQESNGFGEDAEEAEEALSPPPVFSVLTFPSEKSPFLVPFTFAYRSSMMFLDHDLEHEHATKIKLVENDGVRRNAQVVPSDDENPTRAHSGLGFETLSQTFQDIVRNEAHIDISSTQKLDCLIASAYSKSSADFSLPQADLRAAVQTIMYQIHTRRAKRTINSNAEKYKKPTTQEGRGRADEVALVTKLVTLVRLSFPRWGTVKIKKDSDGGEDLVCPWQLELSASDDKFLQEDTMTAALAPSILLSSTRISFGGLVHLIDETLRHQLETVLKYLMANDDNFYPFVPPITDAFASEYSRFVPLSMCLRRILKRLKKQRIKYMKPSAKNGECFVEEQGYGESSSCYYRSIGSLQSDITAIFQNCLVYNS